MDTFQNYKIIEFIHTQEKLNEEFKIYINLKLSI